jgi:N-acetyl-anhydromuramyl-L-alanine amidase AmpD
MPETFNRIASPNFRPGRPAGFTPDSIVLHRTGGTRASLRARFESPASSLSAHYLVARDGTIDSCVAETDTAFHAGVAAQSTWSLIRTGVNPNFHTIAIELEGNSTDDWPAAQTAATTSLIEDIARRWRIPLDGAHVIPHSAIRPSSGCPAPTCPIGAIIAAARARRDGTGRQQPVVRTITRANLRLGSPSLDAPVARLVAAQSDVIVAEVTDAGESVSGNSFWYGDGKGHYLWAGATNVPRPADDPLLSMLPKATPPSSDPMELATPPSPPPAATSARPAIDRTRMALSSSEFVPEPTVKDLIVLHFTAGTTARSAFDTWRNDPRRIATSYLVDLDGSIYEVFPPSSWASHLGVSSPRSIQDRRSIGIEIANVGPLQLSTDDPTVLNWWPKRTSTSPEFTTKFCRLDETEKYVAANFRGKSHFASFPDVQVDAVAALVRMLCAQFSIPPSLPPLSQRFTCDVNAFSTYTGVSSHANFRQDKWDIGPAFPWDRLGL